MTRFEPLRSQDELDALGRRSAFFERITDRTTAVLVALTVAWIAARWLL